jgi:hypothetical protein
MRHVCGNDGTVVGYGDFYDTAGSSVVGMDLAPVMPALHALWETIPGPERADFRVSMKDTSPWVVVKAVDKEYAIWRRTGDVFVVTDGAVGDDPIISA